ncbi:MAG: CoA transferase [Chloroflexota bacterium]|nr:CoA transferase [Dehalococcoidia bacterium]MDW8254559.1 CoA transferase [Chloroflexota bacterium]
MTVSALDGVRVLDLAGPLGWYCTKVLADLGADVLRIEPPGGDPARRLGPFLDGDSLSYRFFNTSKRARTLDLADPMGVAALRALAREADLLVTTERLPLRYEEAAADNPRLVWTAITPFGLSGPHAEWRATDIVGLAAGGLLHLAGMPGSPPSHPPQEFAYFQAGLMGAVGSLIALRQAARTGRGQVVDVSMQESLLNALENTLGFWDLMGIARCRLGRKSFSGQAAVIKCADGYIIGWLGRRWPPFVQWLEREGLLPDHWRGPEWDDVEYRFQHLDEIDEVMQRLIAKLDRATLVAESQRRRIANGPVINLKELLEEPQLIGRDYWVDVEHQDGRVVRYPGAPYKLSKTPWRVRRPAPVAGEHDGQGWLAERLPAPAPSSAGRLPLDGIRIIDFTWQIAGPLSSQIFADHGAEVIKVESSVHPDGLRTMLVPRPPWTDSLNQSGIFNMFNTSKRSITLNLQTEGGHALLRRLIAVADVVIDNYGVDPYPRWGMSEAALRAINPDIIIARSSVMGRSGPQQHFIGFGYSISGQAGLNAAIGFPGDPPVAVCTAHPDYSCNPYHLVIAILAALHHRDRTGEGQLIDLSQHESTVVMNGASLLDYTANGVVAQPSANRHPQRAPHGAYPARGNDRWVALACESDDEWRRLAAAIGQPELADDPRFATLAARKANEDALDAIIAGWTRQWTPREAAERLQAAGVPAAPANTVTDLLRDQHLLARRRYRRIDHPELGSTLVSEPGFLLTETPLLPRRHPVLLGEDTEAILRDLLGLDDEAIAMHYVEGVLQ